MSQNPPVSSAYMQHRTRILRNNPPSPINSEKYSISSEIPGSISGSYSQSYQNYSQDSTKSKGSRDSTRLPSSHNLTKDMKQLSISSSPSRYHPLSSCSSNTQINPRDSSNRYSSRMLPQTQSIPDDPIYANLNKSGGNPPQYSPPPPPPYEAFHNKIGGTGTALPNGHHHGQTGENSIASTRSSPSLYSGSITLNKSLYSGSAIENGFECPIYENLDALQQTAQDSQDGFKLSSVQLDNQYIYAPLSSLSLTNSSSRACPQVPIKKPVPTSGGRVVAHSETVPSRGHLYAEIPSANQFKPIQSTSAGSSSPSPYAVTNVLPNQNTQLVGPITGTDLRKQTEKSKAPQRNARKLLPSITLHKTNVIKSLS